MSEGGKEGRREGGREGGKEGGKEGESEVIARSTHWLLCWEASFCHKCERQRALCVLQQI